MVQDLESRARGDPASRAARVRRRHVEDAPARETGEMIVVMAGRLSGLGLSSSVTIFTVGGSLGPARETS